MPFIGYAPIPRTFGSAGANSIFLTPLTASQSGTATAVLIDGNTGASSISFKALVYDGSHSVLLASGSTVTAITSGYNRLPLVSNLSLVAGTTYYVGYVSSAACNVGTQSSGPGAWFVSGGQSVASPANPLVGGASNASTIMCALEFDGTGLPGFGWGPDFASGVTRSVSNTVATFSSAANLGVRGIVTQVNGAGKFYAEVDVGGTINGAIAVGLASVNWGVTQGVASGNTPGYVAGLFPTGSRNGGGALGLTYVSGDTIGIAYDCVNTLIWWNKNNGSWFGASSTAGNPVTGTNGYAFNVSNWPMTMAAMSSTATAATFALHETAGALRYAMPSGYAPWSSATYPPVVASSQAMAMVLA